MTSTKFTMDPNFERNLAKMVQPAMKKVAQDYERMFASLAQKYKGRPVSEIKPVLRREWRKIAGGDITDPELTKYATYIKEGTKIEVGTGR